MKQITLLNNDWIFIKNNTDIDTLDIMDGKMVNLPHTWNAKDGQDGGNDYYRGKCWYVKSLSRPILSSEFEAWLEFRGAAITSEVYVNGKRMVCHKNGFSTFRVNITEVLQDKNVIAVSVDNSHSREVYPQKADFTFYGGIYRDAYLITVPKAHFSLGYYGGPGIKVSSVIEGTDAHVTVEIFLENTPDNTPIKVSISNISKVICTSKDNKAKIILTIENVHLWNGIEDPYLYTVTAEIDGDYVSTDFGCRNIVFDKDGFILNGQRYPLCGVARHQDRLGVGNAITRSMQDEDMLIMKEMGVNTIRLAHYQHDQYFYDLCDKYGMIVWAEIPYITDHMHEGLDNTISQLTEMVIQNYNHPSIVCWGLSNEITATGITDSLIENHKILNNLCHELDITRSTTMAHVFMLETDHPLVTLPDICSYNLYYGWYVGDLEDNDIWFDEFRKQHPDRTIGLSEFGADANPEYQTATPKKGDWSETYQAVYHEHMLKMWKERPYIWAMHVWNMFDFGADGRNEGGKPGQNQKGLVTFDRKLKKDAFYIYKAYLSKEPFVHLCGSRYIDRTEDITEIKVYSNLSAVSLYVDGKKHDTKTGDKVFIYKVPITGKHKIEAISGKQYDSITICKVSEPNKSYYLETCEIVNWFDRDDIQILEGYYSIKDNINEIKKSPEAAALYNDIFAKISESYGDVSKDVKIPEKIQNKMDNMSFEEMLKQAGKVITSDMVVKLNQSLSKIKKSETLQEESQIP